MTRCLERACFRIKCVFIFILFFGNAVFVQAQAGHWKGFITQDGKQYPMELVLKKKYGKLEGYSTVVVADSTYGGKLYGKLHWDRSMNLWDHLENPVIYPDTLPLIMRRRYQLVFRRSVWGDTIKGYWQEVHTHPHATYRKGWIELKRQAPDNDKA